jgi:hypothetical protein
MTRTSLRDRLRRMNQRSLFGPGTGLSGTAPELADEAEEVSASGRTRAEGVQRLQAGLVGIAAMVLLVGLASIIGGQAERNDELAVPEAAPTTEPSLAPAQANPLADAGVVPDIAAEPSPALPPQAPAGPGNAPPAP